MASTLLLSAALLLALSALPSASSYQCVHDEIVAQQAKKKTIAGRQLYHGEGRRLTGTGYEPLRITPLYINVGADASMDSTRVSFLQNQLLPAAIARWQSLLSTIPVQGPLYAHRACANYWPTTGAYPCANFESTTDCGNNGEDEDIFFGSNYFGTDTSYSAPPGLVPTTYPAGAGVANTDFALFVTAKQTTRCGSGGSGVLAYALTCQRDQFDRPTWGRVNFCPQNLDTAPDRWGGQVGVAVHELAHALGFSSQSWYLFRQPDSARTPRTPRDVHYPDQPASAYSASYTCSGFSYYTFRPSSLTVDYFAERGMTCTYAANNAPPVSAPGVCVAKLVTPRVLDASRAFFACPSLNGAEIENQLTSPCDLQGSHWEQRILSSEIMASYTQHSMKISPITLAVFEDSGWYTANYSMADEWKAGEDWGYAQGCAFATSKCLDSSGNSIGSPPHFYSTSRAISSGGGNAVCTIDRLAVGYVTVAQYVDPLPTAFQYFPTDSRRGGGDPNTFDYCPAVQAYTNRICGQNSSSYVGSTIYGEMYGPGSMCFASNLRKTGYVTTGTGAGCYTTRCVGSGGTASVVVTVEGNDYTCTSAGQTLSLGAGWAGSITCPDPSITCASSTIVQPSPTAPPALPSTSSSPSISAAPSATPSPAAWVITYPFTFPGVNLTYVLGIGSNGLPTGSSFLTSFLSDVCVATGTCSSTSGGTSYPGLLYLHSAEDGRTGKKAIMVYNSVSGTTYLTRMDTVTPSSTYSVKLTLAYRVVVSAPSPGPGAPPNSATTEVGTTVATLRNTVVVDRLAAATANYTVYAPAFSATIAAYCAVADPGTVSVATCPVDSRTAVSSFSGSVILQYANTGSPAQPVTPGGGDSNSASSVVAAIGGAIGGIAFLLLAALAIYCLCAKAGAAKSGAAAAAAAGGHAAPGKTIVLRDISAPPVVSSYSAGGGAGAGGGHFVQHHPQQMQPQQLQQQQQYQLTQQQYLQQQYILQQQQQYVMAQQQGQGQRYGAR